MVISFHLLRLLLFLSFPFMCQRQPFFSIGDGNIPNYNTPGPEAMPPTPAQVLRNTNLEAYYLPESSDQGVYHRITPYDRVLPLGAYLRDERARTPLRSSKKAEHQAASSAVKSRKEPSH